MNIFEYGAVGDGVTNDTQAIQKAINDANVGETFVFPTGYTFKVANLILKSDINYVLEGNCRLLGSDKYEDYQQLTTEEAYSGEPMYTIIAAYHGQNITISGSGTIDGNGLSFVNSQTKYIYKLEKYPRITQLFFENVTNLRITDITIENGCYWTIHPVGCQQVLFSRLKINQDLMMPNCDGIDPDHCQDVIISDCFITSADDCIVLKNTKYYKDYGPTKNITVNNCILKSTSAGFKIGTESFGDFSNITFSNSIIHDSNRGISIQVRDGGNVSDLVCSNLIIKTRKFNDIWWGKGEPIAITSYPRTPGLSSLSKISNVLFSNISMEGENCLYFSALESNLISNIKISNSFFKLTPSTRYPNQQYDNRPFGAEHSGLFDGALVPVFINNVDNIDTEGLSISFDDTNNQS
ncbi:glycosyl hydrolase family 28 protein [Mollicutes bacterium LVI A0039]|nr:glycosyl hydrolase family 28 protein [Mollicutes bacterium LVI A0039]